jgi:DNA-binding transcriptional LysR family regulator
VFASVDYLERHGEPLHPDDLQHHRALAMNKQRRNGSFAWPLDDGGGQVEYRVEPVFVANDPAGLRGALLCGEGLMLANDVMVKRFVERGLLRRVLPAWTGPEYELNAVFPRGRVQSPKVRAFIDFLVDRFDFDADYMQVQCPDKRAECMQAKARAAAAADAELAKVAQQADPAPETEAA